MVEDIRKKTLWESYDVAAKLVRMLEQLVPVIPPKARFEHERNLAESKRDMQQLKQQAERVEGKRD